MIVVTLSLCVRTVSVDHEWNYDGHVKSCARAFGFEEAEDKDIQKLQQKTVPTRQEKHALRKRGLLDETETQLLMTKESELEKPKKRKLRRILRVRCV